MNDFSWQNLNYPIILCPPMDGITDIAFRELIAEMGGSSALYTEFVNVKGILYQNPKTFSELKFTENQRPIIAQLFGSDPDDFYEAAKIIVKLGFDAIDINMGCPAHKVASKGGGCALMGDTTNARNIVEQTIKGANEAAKELGHQKEFEITVKMRLGISTKDTVFTHGISMLEAGAKAIAIHGRTLKQMYTGEADWEPIRQFKQIIDQNFSQSSANKPKVFGSGDVKSLYEAFVRIITTGADGVMIGRGSFGNPWVFDKSKVNLLRETCIKYGYPKTIKTIDEIPTKDLDKIKLALSNNQNPIDKIKKVALHHTNLTIQAKGEKGIILMRKHFGWYFVGFEGSKELRSRLVRVESINELKDILHF